jgi:hydrogenase nickel incorporation protein HypA/HybF
MHELSICQALLDQVEDIARREDAVRVDVIRLHLGPLSGVVPDLLAQAFTVARAGTMAEDAELAIESLPIRIRCIECGAQSEAAPNRLLCGACGGYRTQLLSGDELVLASVELVRAEPEHRPRATV